MTTEDAATIQDGSESIWKLSGGEILILGNRSGEVLGLQSKSKGLTRGGGARVGTRRSTAERGAELVVRKRAPLSSLAPADLLWSGRAGHSDWHLGSRV